MLRKESMKNEYKTPSNVQAEKNLIGLCLTSIDAVNKAAAELLPFDFFDAVNLRIFSAILDLYHNDKPITLDSLKIYLDLYESDYKISPEYYLGLSLSAPKGCYPEDFIEEIKDASLKRKIFNAGLSFAKNADETKLSGGEYYTNCEAEFTKIDLKEDNKNQVLINDILAKGFKGKSFLADLQEKQELFLSKQSVYDGLPSHYLDLDKSLNGFCPGHLIVIAARPGVGKTTFCLQLIERQVFKNDISCLFFSLEMPAHEIVRKVISASSKITYEKIRSGNIIGPEFQQILEAEKKWAQNKFIIEDQAGLTIDQIYSRSKRYIRSYGIGIIFIDYLQLIAVKKKAERRDLDVAEISKTLKNMAKDLNVPVIALAQLNRNLEQREKKQPFLSDLRDSGAIEQDSDEVLFLHRPEIYDKFTKPGFLELIIAKNRLGPLGNFDLLFQKEIGRIENYDFIAETQENNEYFEHARAYKD